MEDYLWWIIKLTTIQMKLTSDFRGVMIRISSNSIRFQLLPFDFKYFDLIMQMFLNSCNIMHNQCKQHATLNPQFEDTIVTGTLIYYTNPKKKTCNLSVFFFLDPVYS